MDKLLLLLIKSFAFLLRLYPRSYRDEFAEEMLLDFSELATDAGKKGIWALALLCLHELVDFPISLLRICWREHMVKILRSHPVNYGFRGALGFGVMFPLKTVLIGNFILEALQSPVDDSPILYLEGLYFDLFQTLHGTEIIRWLPGVLHSLVTGLFLGVMFALLFADRSKYLRYILVTTVCWYLHDNVYSILWHSTNLLLFLGPRHDVYLSFISSVLSGAFLGLIPYVVKSERQGPYRMLLIGAFGYPLIAYLYLQLLFKLSIIETPWMFIALLLLMIVFIGSIFLMAIKSGFPPRMPWLIAVAVIGYILLSPAGYFLMSLLSALTGLPSFPDGMPLPLASSVYGILLGLLFGVLLGFHKKNDLIQRAA